jgi:hypothetical protein
MSLDEPYKLEREEGKRQVVPVVYMHTHTPVKKVHTPAREQKQLVVEKVVSVIEEEEGLVQTPTSTHTHTPTTPTTAEKMADKIRTFLMKKHKHTHKHTDTHAPSDPPAPTSQPSIGKSYGSEDSHITPRSAIGAL